MLAALKFFEIMKKKLKKLINKLEKLPKCKLYLFFGLIFVIFIFLGLLIGYGISFYTIYNLKKYEARIKRETYQRINEKIEKYQEKFK